MKDLLVFVADADIEAFMRALLARPEALGIRRASFDIRRHPRRDSGMVGDGPELARTGKGEFRKALLILDHHGSGRDHRQTAVRIASDVVNRMDGVSWANNHAVAVLEPELEQWLWHCEPALAEHLHITLDQLREWTTAFAQQAKQPPDSVKRDNPKELFEHIVKIRLKHTISPRDFEHIARRASVVGLMGCPSFATIADTLRGWFPPEP